MEIKPIRTDEEFRAALAAIGKLLGAKNGTPESDRLEVLSALVAAWEARHHPIPPPSAIAAIEFEIDQGNLTRKDLERALGSSARVAEVLNGTRELSRNMIWKLHTLFHVPLASLVHEPRGATRRRRSAPRKSAAKTNRPRIAARSSRRR